MKRVVTSYHNFTVVVLGMQDLNLHKIFHTIDQICESYRLRKKKERVFFLSSMNDVNGGRDNVRQFVTANEIVMIIFVFFHDTPSVQLFLLPHLLQCQFNGCDLTQTEKN